MKIGALVPIRPPTCSRTASDPGIGHWNAPASLSSDNRYSCRRRHRNGAIPRCSPPCGTAAVRWAHGRCGPTKPGALIGHILASTSRRPSASGPASADGPRPSNARVPEPQIPASRPRDSPCRAHLYRDSNRAMSRQPDGAGSRRLSHTAAKIVSSSGAASEEELRGKGTTPLRSNKPTASPAQLPRDKY